MNSNKKILIIDKMKGDSYLLVSLLKKWGFQTFVVNSYLKAIDYAKGRGNYFDLVIIDALEIDDTVMFYPAKFQERTGRKIPFILNTIVQDKNMVKGLLSNGYCDILSRPIEPEALLVKVNKALKIDDDVAEHISRCELREHAKIEFICELAELNEFGVLIRSSMKFVDNNTYSLKLPSLIEKGLAGINVKYVGTKKTEEGILCKFDFVGLGEFDYQKIRQVCMYTKKKAA